MLYKFLNDTPILFLVKRYLHHNRGIRTPRRERNRKFGFFFFCAVFVRAAVAVGVIGENQIQKQFVFLSAFQIEKHFHFVVVQHNAINECVNQCFAVSRLGIVKHSEMLQPLANIVLCIIDLQRLFALDCRVQLGVLVL